MRSTPLWSLAINLSLFSFYLSVQTQVPASSLVSTAMGENHRPTNKAAQTKLPELLFWNRMSLAWTVFLSWLVAACRYWISSRGKTPAKDLWKSWNHLCILFFSLLFFFFFTLVQLRDHFSVDRSLLRAAELADGPNVWRWSAPAQIPCLWQKQRVVDYFWREQFDDDKGKWCYEWNNNNCKEISRQICYRLYLEAAFPWCSWRPLVSK